MTEDSAKHVIDTRQLKNADFIKGLFQQAASFQEILERQQPGEASPLYSLVSDF